jgi:hypothetical protein
MNSGGIEPADCRQELPVAWQALPDRAGLALKNSAGKRHFRPLGTALA